jgi:hypothetical protein
MSSTVYFEAGGNDWEMNVVLPWVIGIFRLAEVGEGL